MEATIIIHPRERFCQKRWPHWNPLQHKKYQRVQRNGLHGQSKHSELDNNYLVCGPYIYISESMPAFIVDSIFLPVPGDNGWNKMWQRIRQEELEKCGVQV